MNTLSSVGFPLSDQQKGLLGGNLAPGRLRLEVSITGTLDAARLERSLRAVAQRHEILRTDFQRSSGMKFPFQVVPPEADFDWSVGDAAAQPVLPLAARLSKLGDDRHLLVLEVSALCADARSLNEVVAEVVELYGSEVPSLAEPLQYADYCEWQRQQIENEDEDAVLARKYWQTARADASRQIVLPWRLQHERSSKSAWEIAEVALKPEIWQRLGEIGVTPTAALLAGWQVLLCRLGRQTQLTIGLESAGRSFEELEHAIGVFSKTLPAAFDLQPGVSFRKLVELAQLTLDKAAAYHDAYDAATEGDSFVAGFAVDETFALTTAGGVTFGSAPGSNHDSSCDVMLRVSLGASPAMYVVCIARRFWEDAAARFASSLSSLIEAACNSPESPAKALPLWDNAGRTKALVRGKSASTAVPDRCFHQLFEEQVKRMSERPALEFAGKSLSYAELNADANRLAARLRKLGVNRNVPAGLCVERSAEMIVGILAIAKAGGCYVPLAPESPKVRLQQQIAETGTPVVLTNETFLPSFDGFNGTIVCFDRDKALLLAEPASNPEPVNEAHDLAYIIYTSGSTGVPKGVAVRHSGLVNYASFIMRKLRVEEHAGGLHFATVSTITADLGNTCVFPALLSGGCLHVIAHETAMSASLFAAHARNFPIDVLKITPSHLSALFHTRDGAEVLPAKYLITGGEALSWNLLKEVRAVGRCQVINHYGPTEATVGCCTFDTADDVSVWQPATVPIGKPIDNDEAVVVDAALNPVHTGVVGELCVGGKGLAQGYFNQPEQTAERFIEWTGIPGLTKRLYRTGDLARLLPDGNIEFLGRIDQQVKIRGFRVEPAEIESALRTHPAIHQAAVLAQQNEDGTELTACIGHSGSLSADSLRVFLLDRLPDYMVPVHFVFANQLPLTANGKIDTRALAGLKSQEVPVRQEAIAPRNEDERRIADVWSEVLKKSCNDVSVSFFRLGGHSLLATQIISRLRDIFRVQVPLHRFLECPTIAQLAAGIHNYPPLETADEQMSDLLAELESVSDEEAEALLAEMQKAESAGRGGR